MKVLTYDGSYELVVIALGPGEMLLESIDQAIRENDIRNGVVVSGMGTLKNFHMHYITHTDFPSHSEFVNITRPLELASVSGIIADGEPHLHVVVSCGEREVYAGHLEDQCEVAYLAEIAILKCNDLKMLRKLDKNLGLKLLGPKD